MASLDHGVEANIERAEAHSLTFGWLCLEANLCHGRRLLSPQVNGVALQDAEHHEAVEALRGAGAAVQMRVWRERMVEPENAVTITPLRPEDDYSPREWRGGGLRLPLLQPETPTPIRQRHAACLVRSERGLGFSIAGGKGSTPYRAGDAVRPRLGTQRERSLKGEACQGSSVIALVCLLCPYRASLYLALQREGPPTGQALYRLATVSSR